MEGKRKLRRYPLICSILWIAILIPEGSTLPTGCCKTNDLSYAGIGSPCLSDFPCGFSQSGDTVFVSTDICCMTTILDTFMAPLEKFKACVESYHYPSSDLIRIYENMTKLMPAYAGGITSEAEMMMAIAQMSSESKGFSSTREEACISEPPPERCRYAGDPKYKCNENATNAFYFGRGYIQITGCLNYRAASFALYNDDRLVRNPDLVASDPMVNLEASLWFWKRNVHSRKGVTEGDFGATTKAIHGTGACKNPKWIPNSKLRYKQFIKCLQASGLYDDLKGKVNESGCYPLTKFAKNNHQSIFNFIRYPKLYRQRYVYYWI